MGDWVQGYGAIVLQGAGAGEEGFAGMLGGGGRGCGVADGDEGLVVVLMVSGVV